MVMMSFLFCSLVPPPLPVPLFALVLPCSLVAVADALLGMVDIDLLLLLLLLLLPPPPPYDWLAVMAHNIVGVGNSLACPGSSRTHIATASSLAHFKEELLLLSSYGKFKMVSLLPSWTLFQFHR
jgi:hypothetical protein